MFKRIVRLFRKDTGNYEIERKKSEDSENNIIY